MAEIVNLRRARKRLVREAASKDAAEARSRHGQTRAERAGAAAREAEHRRVLDGAKLARLPGDGEGAE